MSMEHASFARLRGGWQSGAAKYAAVASIHVTNGLVYMADTVLRSLWTVVVLFVFLALWLTTYSAMGRDVIEGFTLQQMLWYLVVTEALILSGSRITRTIEQEVKTGGVALLLLRPFNYVLYHYAAYVGSAALPLMVNLLAGGLVATLGVGLLPVSPAQLAAAALCIFLGLTLFFLNQVCIGLLAFWIEETQGVELVYGRLLWIMGGLLIPVDLFPAALQKVTAFLPFQWVLYAPARVAVAFTPAILVPTIVGQGIWILLLGLLAGVLYRKGVQCIHANGG